MRSNRRASALGGLVVLLAGCGGVSEGDLPSETTQTTSDALVATDVEPLGAATAWTSTAFQGTKGTFFADVNGNHTADAVAVNSTGISVRKSSGSAPLQNSQTWASTAFFGSVGTFVADVTGDGKADVIALSSGNIQVRPLTGSAFGTAQTWLSSGFTGGIANFFADVNGDGKADAISINLNNVLVRLSSGTSFGSSQTWLSSGFFGAQGTYAADVTGDGQADLVAFSSSDIKVVRSNGTSFGAAETWLASPFSGGNFTLLGDMTGNGLADVVSINSLGIRMRRSGRWFFDTVIEQLSTGAPSLDTPFLADLTGDGRADYIELRSAGIYARSRQDRVVPLRIVQFVNSCADARTDADIQAAIDNSSLVHHDQGISFVAQSVTSNPDCAGYTKSHVVVSSVLANITSSTPASRADIAKAIPYNPSCTMGYPDFQDLQLAEQIWWVGARCSLSGEVLINVADTGGTSYSNGASDGNLVLLDRWGGFNVGSETLAHELGHYFGVPHSFSLGQGILIGPADPRTGQIAQLSTAWDLVYTGGLTFNSREAAQPFEPNLAPLEPVANGGWFCPSGDVNKPCPFNQLPGGNPPAGTIGIPFGGQTNNVIYTYLPQTTTFDVRTKGLAPRQPGNVPGINIMSYSYPPADPANLKRGFSVSQIELINDNLKYDVLTKYLDWQGKVIFGRRPLLGITGTAPAITYPSSGGTSANSYGSIAANGFYAWMVGGGFKAYEFEPMRRIWVD